MLSDKTRWSAAEIYSLRLPRVWSLLEGFRKLADMHNGVQSSTKQIAEPDQAASVVAALGGRERTFDNLPLHIQEWSRRCREVNHGK